MGMEMPYEMLALGGRAPRPEPGRHPKLPSEIRCRRPGCIQEGRVLCPKCRQVAYCGAQCLAAHKLQHKTKCKRACEKKP